MCRHGWLNIDALTHNDMYMYMMVISNQIVPRYPAVNYLGNEIGAFLTACSIKYLTPCLQVG